MSPNLQMLLLVIVTYFIGAIPFGFVVGKLKGVDIRKAGSGNIGATNVGRIFGKRYFWLVFSLDAAKGLLPMLAGAYIVHTLPNDQSKYLLWLSAGVAAMVGHVFPIYLSFKGGKGVATSLGVMFGVFPYYTYGAFPTIITFLSFFFLTRYISLGSIMGAVGFPLFLLGFGYLFDWKLIGPGWPLLMFATAVSALVIYRHRSNISRLRAGTEPRFAGRSVKSSEQAQP